MSRKLITGFFGVNNLGDDIMLDAFYRQINEDNSISLLRLYSGGMVDTPIITKDISMFPHGKSVLVSQYLSKKYDGLFWVGGTCMTDSAGDGACGYMSAFKKRGKRIGYIGIGINEIHDQSRKKMYKDILDKADLVTLRDEKSYSIAKSLSSNPNIYLTEDLVYLSNEIIDLHLKSSESKLLIAWRSLRGYCSEGQEQIAIDNLLNFIENHALEYNEIIVSPLGNRIDIRPNKLLFFRLSTKLHNVVYVEEWNAQKRIELIHSATTVITGRLHGIFIAEWNNINTVAIAYDSKVKRFLESINRIEDLVYPNNMDNENLERAFLAKHVTLARTKWVEKQKESMKNIQLYESLS